MKNFIKKCPKRIIITALVVLLIAIIGTVNNYRTYREAKNYYAQWTGSGYNLRSVSEPAMELLQTIYTDDTILVTREGLYYKKINLLFPEIWDKGYNNLIMSTDKDYYQYDETVVVTLNNKKSYYTEFAVSEYVLQGKLDWDTWYALHTGKINKDETVELTHLKEGESYSFEIPLEYISEEHDVPVELRKGVYRICMLITHKANEYSKKTIDIWAMCEFSIK